MKRKTLIIGAGAGGEFVIEQIQSVSTSSYIPVAVLDDNVEKKEVLGVPVVGQIKDIARYICSLEINHVILAIPTLDIKQQHEIIRQLKDFELTYYILPSVFSTAQSQQIAIPRLDYSKLLAGRKEFQLDYKFIKEQLADKTVLITGAGGSIGSEISRQVFRCNPKAMILLGHGEGSIYTIDSDLRAAQEELGQSTEIITVIADIRDAKMMEVIFQEYQPTIVYHAAAHKHVPLMENNVYEAVNNNVIGTYNVLQAAKKSGSEQFVMISTDKAVNPSNVMGATKRLAEKLTLSADGNGEMYCNVVRFGNVLGSRGSVFPKLWKQLYTYVPLTITNPEMKRYFMTIPEASKLVIEASLLKQPNSIFVLDMGEQLKLSDMVDELIELAGKNKEDVNIEYVGVRPGEKMEEELFNGSENATKISDKLYEGSSVTSPEELDRIHELMFTYKAKTPSELRQELMEQTNTRYEAIETL